VCHVVTTLTTGGAETALLRLLRTDAMSDFESSVVCLGEDGPVASEIRALEIPVVTLGIQSVSDGLRHAPRLVRIVAGLGPDLIQGWMYHGNVAALFADTFTGGARRCAWNVRHGLHALDTEAYATRFLIELGRWLSRWVDAGIYNSQMAADQHRDRGYHEVCREVVHNGFDVACFRPDRGAYSEVRRELGLGPEAVLVGHVGRNHPVKGQDLFLEAMAQVEHPDVWFVLAGRRVDWSTTALARKVTRLGLSDRVRLLGERRDMPRFMASLDVLVSSSRSEAFPNVVGEAMAAGVPCVVTDVGDCAELVGDGGIVVPPGRPDALAQGTQTLLGMPAERRVALGTVGRRRIEEHFSLEGMGRAYASLYKRLLLRTPATGSGLCVV